LTTTVYYSIQKGCSQVPSYSNGDLEGAACYAFVLATDQE